MLHLSQGASSPPFASPSFLSPNPTDDLLASAGAAGALTTCQTQTRAKHQQRRHPSLNPHTTPCAEQSMYEQCESAAQLVHETYIDKGPAP
eukprot:35075-Eustigmatos_ZCMA.PRE.1